MSDEGTHINISSGTQFEQTRAKKVTAAQSTRCASHSTRCGSQSIHTQLTLRVRCRRCLPDFFVCLLSFEILSTGCTVTLVRSHCVDNILSAHCILTAHTHARTHTRTRGRTHARADAHTSRHGEEHGMSDCRDGRQVVI